MGALSCVRLGLPLGNALLLIAILETADLVQSELKEVGVFISQGLALDSLGDVFDFYGTFQLIFLAVAILIRLVATIGLLWIGTIVLGNQCCLLSWIILTIVCSVAWTVFFIINTVTLPDHLLQDVNSTLIHSLIYTFTLFVLFKTFVIYIAIATYQGLRRKEPLHPIGKGVTFMWEYFENETKIAAAFFLTTEIVLDTTYLLAKQFIQFLGVRLHGHEGDPYPPIVIEEFVLRIVRIGVNAVGLWIVYTERRRLFRWWCAFTFTMILVSAFIFIVLTVQWRGEDISITIAYFIMFPGHLLFRFVTLYFALKFTRVELYNLFV